MHCHVFIFKIVLMEGIATGHHLTAVHLGHEDHKYNLKIFCVHTK